MNKRLSNTATLKEVAALAEVHPSTVSRVLRSDPKVRVSKTVREKIHLSAKKLHYKFNVGARNLRLQKTQSIALILPSISNPVHYEIAQGVQEAAAKNGYISFICQFNQEAMQNRSYIDLLHERRVDGLIIATARINDSAIKELSDSNCPFVLTNRLSLDSSNYIIVDDSASAEMAVEHLTKLGHRKIAYISGNVAYDNALRRYQGYRKGLEKGGLAFDSGLVGEGDFTDWQSGRPAMDKILLNRDFTAVLAGNLVLAAGVVASLRNAGRRIPEDISVIGFHDSPMAEVFSPSLTTVKMPLYEMGYQASTTLISMLNESKTSCQPKVLPPCGLVLRESTASISSGAI